MKRNDSVEVINSEIIETLSTKVTEEISSKHLNNFLITTILNSDIKTNQDSFFYATFIDSSLTYEILIFNNVNKQDFILEPFILKSYYNQKKNQNSVDLFVMDDKFVLYKNQQFLLLRNIKDANSKDIEIYITQTYNIDIDNIIQIDKKEFETLQDSYLKNKQEKYQYSSIIEDKSYKIFQLFLVVVTIVFIYLVYQEYNLKYNEIDEDIQNPSSKFENSYHKLEKIYNNHNTKAIDKTVEFFRYLKINKITIKKFEYNENKIMATLVQYDKKRLLNFLTTYKDDIEIKSIVFQKDTEDYMMDVIIDTL